MDYVEFSFLFQKYLDNRCTPGEAISLLNLLQEETYRSQALEVIGQQAARPLLIGSPDQDLKHRLEQRLQSILSAHAEPHRPVYKIGRQWWAAAASIILISVAAWLWYSGSRLSQPPVSETPAPINDIAPGGNKATLTLSGGQHIILDSAANGNLAQQGNTHIIKLSNGQLAYHAATASPNQPVAYNTLTTPRGGQYRLDLPDGSTVWLNAASSITYPTAFTGDHRDVRITGEAYFEVAKNASRPFRVTAGDMTVDVLGTNFNVNAYIDEKIIKTSLLEGSVRIGRPNGSQRLVPGQQAWAAPGETVKVIEHADMEEAIAWKNGIFQFDNADLKTVLRQLSRWYDIDIQYQESVPARQFQGEMGRDLNLSQILKILGRMDVRFRIEGRTLIVQP